MRKKNGSIGLWLGSMGLALAGVAGTAAAQAAQAAQDGPVRSTTPLEVPRLLPSPEELSLGPIDSEVRWLVDRMASPIYEEREAATSTLLMRGARFEELCALLEEPSTNAEQRFRILSILRQMLVAIPSGALGITMQPRDAEPGVPAGVEVTELLEGLPAERVLERRDRITHIDGRPLIGQRDLVIIVQSKRPGERVKLSVARPQRDAEGLFIRDDQGRIAHDMIETTLALGSVDDLHDPVTGRPQPDGLIRTARAAEAAEAERRYMPRPELVPVRDADAIDFVAPRPAPITEAEIANHSIIKQIRNELAMLERDGLEVTEALRQQWDRQHRSLESLASDRSLSPRDGELMRRIAVRFAELTRR